MEQQLITGLVDRGIPLHLARGMVANMIAESGLNPGVNEAAPVVAGSRGGDGVNQWTGPRRRQYEAFASDRGTDLADPNTQLDFTLWELQNTEKSAWNALQAAPDEVTAARIYSERFLRPGVPHLDRRLSEAARLAGTEYTPQNGLAGIGAQPQPGQPPQNALGAVAQEPAPPAFKTTQLDPRAFQMPQNQLSLIYNS